MNTHEGSAPPNGQHPVQEPSKVEPGKPSVSKVFVYVLVALLLIGACSVWGRKTNDSDAPSSAENGGFFSKLFGEGDEIKESDVDKREVDNTPDGKGYRQ